MARRLLGGRIWCFRLGTAKFPMFKALKAGGLGIPGVGGLD